MSHANCSTVLFSSTYLFLLVLIISQFDAVTCGTGNGGPSDAAADTTSPPLSLADQSDELTIDAERAQSWSVMSEKDEFLDDANSLRLVPIDVLGAPQQSLRYLSAPLSDGKTSILIPLPSDLDEKTGLVFVEDIRADGDLSSRTFRTHIFRPSRSSPISFDVTPARTTASTAASTSRVRGARHSTGSNVNTLNNVNKLLGRIEFDSTKAPRTTTTTSTAASISSTSTTEPTTGSSEEEAATLMTVTKPSTVAKRTTRLPRRTASNKRINSDLLESLRTAITSAATAATTGSDSVDSVDSAETTTSSNDFNDVTLTTMESLRRRPPTTTSATVWPRNSVSIVSAVTGNTITTTTVRTQPVSTTVRSTTVSRTLQRIRDRPRPILLPPTAVPVPAALIANRTDASRMRDRETESVSTTTSPVAVSSSSTSTSTTSASTSEANSTLSLANSASDESSSSESEPFRVRGTKAFGDFPTYAEIPSTKFDCKNVDYPGFYADLETGCQVYHSCSRGRVHSFLCPNGTIFSQEFFVCDWAYNVDCEDAPKYYELNKDAFSSPRSKNRNEKKENAIAASA